MQSDTVIDYDVAFACEENLHLALLSGATINIDGLLIKPYTLGEMTEVGYYDFMMKIRSLMLQPEELTGKDMTAEATLRTLGAFNTFDLMNYFLGPEMHEVLVKGLEVILRDKITSIQGKNFLVVGDYDDDYEGEKVVVNADNFEKIIKLTKLMNHFSDDMAIGDAVDDGDENPADEFTRQLLERRKQLREKIKKIKNQSGQESNPNDNVLDFTALISSITTKSSHINKKNVWEYHMYAIYDEYDRLNWLENYQTTIGAMLAGASGIEMVNWVSKTPDAKNEE